MEQQLSALAGALVRDGATSVQVQLTTDGVDHRAVAGVRQAGGPPITTDAPFRAGSVTKVLVGVAVMRLVEAGRLRLDQTVADLLPDAPGVVRELTVDNLLRHTGGVAEPTRHLPLYELTDDGALGPQSAGLLTAALATGLDHDARTELIARDQLTPSATGSFLYSNANYWLLGDLIGHVTGTPWDQHVTTTILHPLGMRDSFFPADSALPDHAAHAYQQLPDGDLVDVTALDASIFDAAGALVSTTGDLVRLALALDDQTLVRADTWQLMRRYAVPTPVMSDYGIDAYGLGIITFSTPCGNAYGGSGTVNGYSTAVYVRPGTGTAVAVNAAEGTLPFLDLAGRVVALTRTLLCGDLRLPPPDEGATP